MRAESTLFAVYVFGFRVPLKSTCARKPPYKHFKLDFVNLHHDILLFFAKHTMFGFRFSVFGCRLRSTGVHGPRYTVFRFGFRFSVFGFHLWVDER